MAATLYAVPASHPCACVERALQLKAIEYRRIDMPPVAHKASRRRCSAAAPCPGSCSTASKILGSLHIIRALDEQVPEPPLFPADPKERKSVELAEGWGDEVLQPLVRRVIWSALRRAPAAIPSYSEGSRLAGPGAARAAERAAGRAAPSSASTPPPTSTSAPTSRTSTTTSRASTAGSSTR